MLNTTEPMGGTNRTPLATIELLAQDYDKEAALLDERVSELEAELTAVKNRHMAKLKRQAGIVATSEAALRSAVEAAPELFKRPRTFTLHGVKVGFTSSVGRLAFDDGESVLKRIKAQYGELAGDFINTKESPDKEALKELDAAQLRKLGCRIEGAGDQVVCSRVAGDVERLLEKLTDKMVAVMVGKD